MKTKLVGLPSRSHALVMLLCLSVAWSSHTFAQGTATSLDRPIEAGDDTSEAVGGSFKSAEGSFESAEGSFKSAEGSFESAEGSPKLAEGSSTSAEGSSKLAGDSSPSAEGSSPSAEGSSSVSSNALLNEGFSAPVKNSEIQDDGSLILVEDSLDTVEDSLGTVEDSLALQQRPVVKDWGAKPSMGFSVWDRVSASSCVYRMTFLGDDELLLESGEQVAIKNYKIRKLGRSGFYTFNLITRSHNKQTDCDGKEGVKVGKKHGTYLKFNAAGDEFSFHTQADESGQAGLRFKRR